MKLQQTIAEWCLGDNPFTRKSAGDARKNPFARKPEQIKPIQKSESFFNKVEAAEVDESKQRKFLV